jgi:hypothetical protein
MKYLPIPPRAGLSNAFSLSASAGLEKDDRHTVFSIAISESELTRFNLDNDGSSGTMISLLLSRAIAGLFPTTENAIRIALCVNQRKALRIKADACRCS